MSISHLQCCHRRTPDSRIWNNGKVVTYKFYPTIQSGSVLSHRRACPEMSFISTYQSPEMGFWRSFNFLKVAMPLAAGRRHISFCRVWVVHSLLSTYLLLRSSDINFPTCILDWPHKADHFMRWQRGIACKQVNEV